MLLLALAGCNIIDLITNVQETVDDLTNPVIIQSTFIGIGDPPEGFDLPDAAGLAHTITALLADAETGGDLAESPVQGANATLKIGSQPPITLAEATGDDAARGYSADASDGLTYEVGADALLRISTDTIAATATWVIPDGLDLDVPCRLASQQDLVVVMDDDSYHSPLVTVIDSDGAVTWTNFPADINAAVEWVNGGGFSSVTVPGAEAFAADGAYIVGIAPLQRATPESFEGANTSLSAFMVGQMRFWSTAAGEILLTDSGPVIQDTGCLGQGDVE